MQNFKTIDSEISYQRVVNFDFLDKLDITKIVKSRISLLLTNVERGNSHAVYSPYNQDGNHEDIFNEWRKIIYSHKLGQRLCDLELQQEKITGPRSISLPWSLRRDSVVEYFKTETQINNVHKLRTRVSDGIKRNRLRPISLLNALGFLKSDTNSGLPHFAKKKLVKDIIFKDFDSYLRRKDACILFTRTQEILKTRNVWGYPCVDTLNEMMYYRPLFNYQKTTGWRNSLLGPTFVDNKISRMLDLARQQDKYVVSIDFSAYDSTVKAGLQIKAFDYIKSLFQKEYHPGIDYICDRFNSIGLVTPDGILFGAHGIPSGSTFTNEVGSIVQYLIAKSFGIHDDCLEIQGDDGVYITEDPKGLLKHFERYGLKVNISKTRISKKFALFLQNLHDVDYVNESQIKVGIYPSFRCLNRILFPERFVDIKALGIAGKDYFSIRTLCILENCKHHPIFDEICKFVFSLDKYKLQFSEHALEKYVSYLDSSSGVSDIFDYRYSESPKGIKSFKSYKAIQKLCLLVRNEHPK